MPISEIYLDDPPAYIEEEIIKKPPVQVCGPPENPVFEPVERQRHFGILTYTVNDRLKKMMILHVILILLLAGNGVTLLTILLHQGCSEELTSTTPEETTATSSTSIKTTPDPAFMYATGRRLPLCPRDTSCGTTRPLTFLFAYSNDLSSKTVLDSRNQFLNNVGIQKFSYYGSVRFDTSSMDIPIYSNINDFHDAIQNNLPNPNIGFQSYSIGSNVFDAIESTDGTIVRTRMNLQVVYSKMSLDYNYSGSDVHNLQIRIYSATPTNNWLPYND
ncbi:Protein CBG15870 [Caenorhabditis briggsae]|uniref:Protein CBG15870 n=1 Tax=Caenorhabditis briggsae TaxID=6238 RepID=A8XMU9_CAEBR|nr:Protein CBG15870 [Caenorhabditis briggsae]CAP33974.2 Protein CBG15870 [Caenorhabditis briggsae]